MCTLSFLRRSSLRSKCRRLLTIFCLGGMLSIAAAADLRFPHTPAGHIARQRLQAFNSGDVKQLQAFQQAHEPSMSIENELGLRMMTGGLEPLRITRNEPRRITLILREKDGDRVGSLDLALERDHPSQVRSVSLAPMPVTPEDLMPVRLSEAEAWRRLQAKAERLVQQDRFAGTIVVANTSGLIHTQSWGLANRDRQLMNTFETRFRVGSLYKMLTAVAVLQLLEQGRLSLHEPLSTYLPDYPNPSVAQQLTLHHLLNHTAGTGDIFTEEYQQQRNAIREHTDYLSLFAQRPLRFPPGSKEEYSNYGYVLLGRVLEVVSGKSYHQLIQENILDPLAMRDTGTEPEENVAQQLAVSYTNSETGVVDARDSLPWRGTAAGGGYTSAKDLSVFAKALLEGRIIKAKTLALATRSQVPSGLYGYGFQLGGTKRASYFGHVGGAEGMNASLRIYPATGNIVFALSNLDPPAADELVQYYGNRMPLDRYRDRAKRPLINK